eukprot:11540534-Alexandrium_andersonii.AAC.1
MQRHREHPAWSTQHGHTQHRQHHAACAMTTVQHIQHELLEGVAAGSICANVHAAERRSAPRLT